MYEIAFVIEQALGHITHGDNLRAHVPADADVNAHWALLPYDAAGPAARIPLYRSNWSLRSGLAARRALRRIGRVATLDALFFHTQVPTMLCPGWINRVPTVISMDATPHQYDELGLFYQHETDIGAIERLKTRIAKSRFHAARHLVTWSAWAKRGLVDDYGVPDDKITVVPPGVTVADWTRRPRRVDPARPVSLLFVGGDIERKGGTLLIDAFRAVRHLGVELHVVTRDAVDEEPGVHVYRGLQPNSPELQRLYHDCDVFVLPTYGDCLPMVLSEAGAAGLAIISTRVAAIPEIVVDGDTGLLIPPGDVTALTDALRRLLERPHERLRMGERAALHVAQQYDTTKNTPRLLEILKDVADRD